MRRRALVLRLHLVTALVTGGALLLVGLSGAVLVFRAELEEAMYARARVSTGSARLPLQALLEGARVHHPGFTPAGLTLPEVPGRPVRVDMVTPAGDAVVVLVDPSTGRVIHSRWRERSPLHALRTLHAELYMGARGRVVVAGLGLALLAQGITGLYLWWPFVRRPGRGFAVRWGRSWPAVSFDLHKVLGIASSAFNLPIALTGAALGFAALAPPSSVAGGPEARATADPPLPLDALVRRAEAALPGGSTVSVHLGAGAVIVRRRLPGDLDARGASLVALEASTGRVLEVRDARREGPGWRLWALAAPLHYGDFAGRASKLLYAAGGLASAALVITGFGIWLTRPRRAAARSPADPAVAAVGRLGDRL
jgi:uncharacterized iron-regulated membrane protein